jgi:predicted outer membrane repeat protein
LNVAGCIFSGNHAAESGGALSLSGVATITGCTFFNNTSANGGAVFNNATLIINNSTLFGNGDPAIVNSAGTMQVLHCTISGNTNGVSNNSAVPSAAEVNNTIIAGNSGVGGFDVKARFFPLASI